MLGHAGPDEEGKTVYPGGASESSQCVPTTAGTEFMGLNSEGV